MVINEVHASSIISKSNLPDTDYVINPYIGCSHSCIYCYARFMKRFTGHQEKWGTFVDVKVNAPSLIPQKTLTYTGKSIFLSSVTDPYLQLEKKYQLTRRILERLVNLQPSLGIQTKSALVLRDCDLLAQFDRCEVGMTITTLDDGLRKEVEPYTSSVEQRIDTLKRLKAQGIVTYVFIGPIFPYLTDWREIVHKTRQYVDFYMFENLNTSGTIWKSIKDWIDKKHPYLCREYQEIYSGNSDYWQVAKEEMKAFGQQQGINCRIYFHHGR